MVLVEWPVQSRVGWASFWLVASSMADDKDRVSVRSWMAHMIQRARKRDSAASLLEARFEVFWSRYPRKLGKEAAKAAFLERQPSDELVMQMLVALDAQRITPAWQHEEGQFVPTAANWLRQGQWKAEP